MEPQRQRADVKVHREIVTQMEQIDVKLIPLHKISRENEDELVAIVSNKDVMAYIATGIVWDIKYVKGLIKYSEKESTIPEIRRKYLHYGILLGTKLIGYVGIRPTLIEVTPGSQIRIIIDTEHQGKGIAQGVLRQLDTNPLLWNRMLWAFTSNDKAVKAFGKRWTPGPVVKIGDKDNSSFFHWVFHKCNRCTVNKCYLDRMDLIGEIKELNKYLASGDDKM
jgi:hypothetical protein